MKSTCKDKESLGESIVFPWLAESMSNYDGKCIVLFSSPGQGIVVYAEEDSMNEVGDFSEDWAMNVFESYKGFVTLEG